MRPNETGAARDENPHPKHPPNENIRLRVVRHTAKDYFPDPAKTSTAVFIKIQRSSFRLQLRMYSKSSSTHSSKSLTSFRPLTCQRHVIPGLTVSFCFWYSLKRTYSLTNGGLGPTKLISPFKTL